MVNPARNTSGAGWWNSTLGTHRWSHCEQSKGGVVQQANPTATSSPQSSVCCTPFLLGFSSEASDLNEKVVHENIYGKWDGP